MRWDGDQRLYLYRTIRVVRWVLPLSLFLVVLATESVGHDAWGIVHLLFPALAHSHEIFFLLSVVVFGVMGPFVVWWVLGWIALRVKEEVERRRELESVYEHLRDSNRQLAILHDISRNIASMVEPEEVVDFVAKKAAQAVGGKGASLILFDEQKGTWSTVSTCPIAKSYEQAVVALLNERREHWTYDRQPILGNLQVDEETSISNPSPTVASLSVPLARGDKLIGALTVFDIEPHPAPEEKVAMLATIANEVATAIESAFLRTRQLQALYSIDETLRAEFNLNILLQQSLTRLMEACAANCGAIVLYSEEKSDSEPPMGSGEPRLVYSIPIADHEHCQEVYRNLGKQPLTKEGPVLITNSHGSHLWSEQQMPAGPISLISEPMSIEGKLIGLIALGRHRPTPFSRTDSRLLSSIASYAALIVRNAQLYASAEELAIAEERSRIAREIHDGLAQNLAFLMLKVDLCSNLLDRDDERVRAELAAIKESLRENIHGVRRSIFALRPVELEKLGLFSALGKFVEEFAEQNSLSIQLSITGEHRSLPAKLEASVFRLVQEALNNVAKHAKARDCWVQLDLSSLEQITLSIRDDGQGFDVERLSEAILQGHLGLAQMREQVSSLNGAMDIHSASGHGTELTITMPAKR